jgi:hypothetical protein
MHKNIYYYMPLVHGELHLACHALLPKIKKKFLVSIFEKKSTQTNSSDMFAMLLGCPQKKED